MQTFDSISISPKVQARILPLTKCHCINWTCSQCQNSGISDPISVSQ